MAFYDALGAQCLCFLNIRIPPIVLNVTYLSRRQAFPSAPLQVPRLDCANAHSRQCWQPTPCRHYIAPRRARTFCSCMRVFSAAVTNTRTAQYADVPSVMTCKQQRRGMLDFKRLFLCSFCRQALSEVAPFSSGTCAKRSNNISNTS
eukprot:5717005-Pleurochrysis_carterae.AAC.1